MKISRVLFRMAVIGALAGGVHANAQSPQTGSKSISDEASEVAVSPPAIPGRIIADRSTQQLGDSSAEEQPAAEVQPKEAKPKLLSLLPGTKVLSDAPASIGDESEELVSPTSTPSALVAWPVNEEGQEVPPVATAETTQTPNVVTTDACSGTGISSNCDSILGGNSLLGRHRSALAGSSCNETYYWLDAEALLWFGDNLNSPPLVNTAAAGVVPLTGNQGVTQAFGGDNGIDTGMMPGYRFTFGTWLDSCRTVGVSGRVYGLFSGSSTFSQASSGGTSIGVPYIDYNSGLNAVYDIAYATGGVTHWEGDVAASNSLSMVGAEALGNFLVAGDESHRVTFLGGYGFNRLDNDLSIESFRVNRLTGDLIPDGTTFDTSDNFSTSNTFHGGILGLQTDFRRGRFTIGSLAKVGFGNMHQLVNIAGRSTVVDGNTGAITNLNSGVLAQPSNSGIVERDRFAFMPELGVKMGYDIRRNLQFTVGYTFLFWSDVALAGDQINTTVDLLQQTSNPSFQFKETGYWMQGIDLGVTYRF